MQTIFCIVGKSSSGKDSILKELLKVNNKLTKLIPITTRPIRENEKDGVDYIFKPAHKFTEMVLNNKLMEHRKYNVINEDGNPDIWYYGNTYPKEYYSILIGTLESLSLIQSTQLYTVIPIYIDVEPSIRSVRMVAREEQNKNPNIKEVTRRFDKDEQDFCKSNLLMYNIYESNTFNNNEDGIDKVVDEINTYIKSFM